MDRCVFFCLVQGLLWLISLFWLPWGIIWLVWAVCVDVWASSARRSTRCFLRLRADELSWCSLACYASFDAHESVWLVSLHDNGLRNHKYPYAFDQSLLFIWKQPFRAAENAITLSIIPNELTRSATVVDQCTSCREERNNLSTSLLTRVRARARFERWHLNAEIMLWLRRRAKKEKKKKTIDRKKMG